MVTPRANTAAAASLEQDDVARLLLAICHETANWVSAIRMSAHLLDHELSPVELASAALDIDDLSARVGGMLGLVRPLIEGAAASGALPANVMIAVAGDLETRGGRGVKLAIGSGAELPEIAGEPDSLQQLVVGMARYALDAARPDDSVSIRAELADANVVFTVEDDGPEDPELRDWRAAPLRGRVLGCALAGCILDRWGGRIDVERAGDTTRVSLIVPVH